MNLLFHITLYLFIFSIFGSVFVCIFTLSMENEKLQNKIHYISFLTTAILAAIFMGIVLPLSALSTIFKSHLEFLYIIAIVFSVWLIISIVIKFKNHLILLTNTEKEIYIRDVTVNYSPAVLSYLMNNKIETKKDLSATLLNLCVNKVLKINKTENGKMEIVDLNNKEQVRKLSNDEKYAYEMFKTGITVEKIRYWKNVVENEYNKYKFSRKHKTNLGSYLLFTFILLIFIVFAYAIYHDNTINDFFVSILSSTFFGAWTITILTVVKKAIFCFKDKSLKTSFIDTLTKKDALEYNRWKKFEKFIVDFTLIKNRDYQAIEILGKYLSYSIALGINTKCDSELYNKININYDFNLNNIINMFNV